MLNFWSNLAELTRTLLFLFIENAGHRKKEAGKAGTELEELGDKD